MGQGFYLFLIPRTLSFEPTVDSVLVEQEKVGKAESTSNAHLILRTLLWTPALLDLSMSIIKRIYFTLSALLT